MCSPVALAAVGMGQAYMSVRQRNAAAAQVAASGNAQMAASAANTTDILNDISAQQGETNITIGKQKTLRILQGLRERAFLRAALAEGVGSSRAPGASAVAESSDIGSLEFSRGSAIGQAERQKKGALASHTNIVNQSIAAANANKGVSPLNALLEIGLAGFSGYMQGEALNAKYKAPAQAPVAALPKMGQLPLGGTRDTHYVLE